MIPTYWYWTNWAKTQACFANVKRPCTKEQLVDVARAALVEGPVRVAGGSLSWSPLVPTTGTIIDVSRLDRILAFSGAPTNTVRVEPGVTIERLTAYLAERGYSLECPTMFPKPTIGGAIAAGCHGTGTFWAPFSDSVVGLEILDGTGTLRTVDTTQPGTLDAARVSLGLFGVITAIELRVVPDFELEMVVRPLSVAETMADIPGLLASHEYVFFMGFPFEDTLWARLGNRTNAPVDPVTIGERVYEQLDATFERVTAKFALPYFARWKPEYTPLIVSAANRLANQVDQDVERASREMHFQKGYPRAVTMSFALPVEQTANAWLGVDRIVRWFRARGMYPVNMAYVARFVGASTSYLSPAYGRPTCFFEVTTAVETPDQDDFFRKAWDFLLSLPGARPHWGKRWEEPFSLAPPTYPKLPAFLAERAPFDPNRRFVNEWLADLGF